MVINSLLLFVAPLITIPLIVFIDNPSAVTISPIRLITQS